MTELYDFENWPDKDPAEAYDNELDWTARLTGGETISTATWEVTGGLVEDSSTVVGAVTKIWLSGGTLGKTAECTCTIETSAGRTYARTATLNIRRQ